MLSIEDENKKLKEELKAQKATSWQTIMSWRTRHAKTQETLQAEIDARDKQLRDIAASLILLESQLQKERKRMASELSAKNVTILQLQSDNNRLTELHEQISEKMYNCNKPSPVVNAFSDQRALRADRKARRAVSEDRQSSSSRKSSSDRATSRHKMRHNAPSSGGQVVIERRSREKRVEKNIASDSSDEGALRAKKKAGEPTSVPTRRRITRSMREHSPLNNHHLESRKLGARMDRGGSTSSGCSTASSSDEPTDYMHISPMSRIVALKSKSSTLPARCDPSLLNQWAKNELEQGIII